MHNDLRFVNISFDIFINYDTKLLTIPIFQAIINLLNSSIEVYYESKCFIKFDY